MAKSGNITITQETQDIVNNKTLITVKGTITTSGESYRGNHRSGTITVTQDGVVVYSGTFTSGAPANSTTTLFSISLTINHKIDGSSGSIVASYNYDSGWCSASKATTLTSIARKSTPTLNSSLFTITKENVNFMRIYTNRKSTSFTHHIYYSINGGSEVELTSGVTDQYDWYFPDTLANQMPNSEKVKGYIRLYTFSGSTNIGSNTVAFEIQVSDDIIPTATVTLSDAVGYLEKYGKYVQGNSKLRVQIVAEGVYGSSIKSCKTMVDGKTYTEAEFTTDALAGKDTLDVVTTVTDTRDRSIIIEQSIDVYEYSKPKITSIKAKRCQEHNVNELGADYLGVVFSSEVTSLDGQNTVAYEVVFKPISYSPHIKYPALGLLDYINQYSVTDGYCICEASDEAYIITLGITDNFGYIEKTIKGPSVSVLVSKLKYNLGLAFGKLAELSGVLDIGFKTRFFGGILHMVLENGTKADEVLTPNKYLVKSKYTYEGFPEEEVDAVLDVVGDDEVVKQTFSVISKTNPRVYERVYTNEEETWSGWICLSGDFVIEQGVSGIWTYRKWNSGIVECWGSHSVTLAIDTQVGNCYRCATQYATLPFTVYNMQHFVDCTDLNTWASNGPGSSNGTTVPYLLWRGSSFTSYTWYTKIYVIGRWKE